MFCGVVDYSVVVIVEFGVVVFLILVLIVGMLCGVL